MAHDTSKQSAAFGLPLSVVEPGDIRKMSRELEGVDEFLRQARLRKPGSPVTAPKTTKNLDSFLDLNGITVLDDTERARAAKLLEQILADAPVIHISFAAEPSSAFMAKIMTWLRQNVHPFVLVQIGLQPSIAAGCTVRTENKVFDFSMRQYLLEKRDLLTQAISEMEVKEPAATVPAPAAVPLPAERTKPVPPRPATPTPTARAVHARPQASGVFNRAAVRRPEVRS